MKLIWSEVRQCSRDLREGPLRAPLEETNSMKIAILNSNLAPGGKSAAIVEVLAMLVKAGGHEPMAHHLSDLSLPHCDGYHCYRDETTIALTAELVAADAIILVSPVYNYDLNAAAKNLIELTGFGWKGKAVGLVCTAAADRSYLSPISFMNSLAIDYRCLVSPRFVYVTRSDFAEDNLLPEGSHIIERLDRLCREIPILAEAAAKIAMLNPAEQL
jgi:NAD(P)H-dependent FMN reductase